MFCFAAGRCFSSAYFKKKEPDQKPTQRSLLAIHYCAAVWMQNLTCHVRRIVGREKHVARRDFFKPTGEVIAGPAEEPLPLI